MIFGREPAAIAALVKAVITMAALTLLPLTSEQQMALNALAAAILGFTVAWQVAAEKALPAIIGLVEAGIYVAANFGLHLSQDKQAALLAVVGAIVALITRDRVVAAVGPAAPVDGGIQRTI